MKRKSPDCRAAPTPAATVSSASTRGVTTKPYPHDAKVSMNRSVSCRRLAADPTNQSLNPSARPRARAPGGSESRSVMGGFYVPVRISRSRDRDSRIGWTASDGCDAGNRRKDAIDRRGVANADAKTVGEPRDVEMTHEDSLRAKHLGDLGGTRR